MKVLGDDSIDIQSMNVFSTRSQTSDNTANIQEGKNLSDNLLYTFQG